MFSTTAQVNRWVRRVAPSDPENRSKGGTGENCLKRAGSDDALRCSFCHKSQDVVGKLISSPSDYPRAYICDECIAVCNSILEDDKPEPAAPGSQQDPEAAGSQGISGSVRDRAGSHQEEAGGRGLQPLQAHPHEPDAEHRSRACRNRTSC